VCKKTTDRIFRGCYAFLCDENHKFTLAFCYLFVMYITKYFHPDLTWCDLAQVMPRSACRCVIQQRDLLKNILVVNGENETGELCSVCRPFFIRPDTHLKNN